MLDILYEDNHLLVVKKPQNVPTQPDSSKDENLLDMCKSYIKEKYNKKGEVFLGLVHRLDRPTGGIVVFAKTSKAANRLSEQIRNHEFNKKYIAVVCGVPNPKNAFLEHYLVKDEKNNKVSIATQCDTGAKLCKLSYNTLETNGKFSLVEVELITGRSHQIRVQMSANKTPIFADKKYNPNAIKGYNLALIAYKLQFTHPTTKNLMSFVIEPPFNELPWKLFSVEKHISFKS